MNIHKNARTTFHGRLLMVRRVIENKQPVATVAADQPEESPSTAPS
jgi:leucine-zipper of insertion element IS481